MPKSQHVTLITADTPPIVSLFPCQHRSRSWWGGKTQTKQTSVQWKCQLAATKPDAACAISCRETGAWLCSHVCPQWPVRCDTRIWTLDKKKWQRTREDPRSLLWCIEAITTWLTRSNGESQDSSREEWIRLKQHNTAASVVQCQQKQMGRWNSCVSKLIGCAASSWQPVSVDVLLVTD